jgi:cation transport ATPase
VKMENQKQADGLSKLQVKIGGMQCSFCVETIHQALIRMEGVNSVSVSLAHEEVLVHYDPEQISPQQLKDTLSAMGYTWRDPEKVRSFEEEEAELRIARNKFLVAVTATIIALALMTAMWLGFRQPWFRWPMLVLALGTMFWPAWHIKRMAWASLRRRILNQHVLLEFAAFAGLAGGFIGFFRSEFPIPDFFGVAVFVTTYHLLSGYVSLLARTRSSQAIKRLMALQPATARIVRDDKEEEVPVNEVNLGDFVRIRPGESIPVDGLVEEGASTVDQSLVTQGVEVFRARCYGCRRPRLYYMDIGGMVSHRRSQHRTRSVRSSGCPGNGLSVCPGHGSTTGHDTGRWHRCGERNYDALRRGLPGVQRCTSGALGQDRDNHHGETFRI